MNKHFALVSVLLLVTLSTAGCIDIYLAHDLLVPRKEKEPEYIFQSYHFADNFTSNPPEEILQIYNEEFPIEVKPDTEHMRIDISVTMRSAKEVIDIINDTIPDGPFKDLLLEFLEQALEYADQRYIEVTVKLPDGFELYNRRFNQTNQDELELIRMPNVGTWIVEVEGAGIGGGDESLGFEYNDAFSVDVILKELKE